MLRVLGKLFSAAFSIKSLGALLVLKFSDKKFDIVEIAAQLSCYSYIPDSIAGWSAPRSLSDGVHLTGKGYWAPEAYPNLTARVLVSDKFASLSFTGTDEFKDWGSYKNIIFTNLYERYAELINAFFDTYKDKNIIITGHSLGGAIVNEISRHLHSYDFNKSVSFAAFSSPDITNVNGIINIGFDQDNLVYELGSTTGDSISRPKDMNFAGNSPVYVSGNYNSHSMWGIWDGIQRIRSSSFANDVRFDDSIYIIGKMDPVNFGYGQGRNAFDASKFDIDKDGFYIFGMDKPNFGRYDNNNDFIAGSRYADNIDGMRGDDIIYGGKGRDVLYGEDGSDTFNFVTGDVENGEYINGGKGKDSILAVSSVDLSISTLVSVENINFGPAGATLTVSASKLVSNGIGRMQVAFSAAQDAFIVQANTPTNKSAPAFIFANQGTDDTIQYSGSNGADVINASGRATVYSHKGDDLIFNHGDLTISYERGDGNDTLKGGGASHYDFHGAFVDYLQLLSKTSSQGAGVVVNLGNGDSLTVLGGSDDKSQVFTPENTGLAYDAPEFSVQRVDKQEGDIVTINNVIANKNMYGAYKSFSLGGDISSYDIDGYGHFSIVYDATKNQLTCDFSQVNLRAGVVQHMDISSYFSDGYKNAIGDLDISVTGLRDITTPTYQGIAEDHYGIWGLSSTVNESDINHGWFQIAWVSLDGGAPEPNTVGVFVFDHPEPPDSYNYLDVDFKVERDRLFMRASSHDFNEQSYYGAELQGSYNAEDGHKVLVEAVFQVQVIDDVPTGM